MSIVFNDNIQVNSPKPIDNKYGVWENNKFRAYKNIIEVTTLIPISYRSVGLTVLIEENGLNVEYWFKDNIYNSNLVKKEAIFLVENGLNRDSQAIKLGGEIVEETNIQYGNDLDNVKLHFKDEHNLEIGKTFNGSLQGVDFTTAGDMIVSDPLKEIGFVYDNDFSTQGKNNPNWIPSWKAVTDYVAEYVEEHGGGVGVIATPSISVNSPNREVGASGAYTLTWSVTKGSTSITNIEVDGQPVAPTGESQSGTKTGTAPNTLGIVTKTISVTDGNGTKTDSTQIRFSYKLYFGSYATDIISDADIKLLPNNSLDTATQYTYTTGIFNRFFAIWLPSNRDLVSVIDIGNLNLNITSFFVKKTMNIVSDTDIAVPGNVWVMENQIPYNPSTQHRFTINNL